MAALGGSYLLSLLGLFAFFVVVLWIFMPFAIFGTKAILERIADNQDKLLAEQKTTNELLLKIYRRPIEEALRESQS